MSSLLLRFPSSQPGNSPPIVGSRKFLSGHYMASDTFDGTGGSQNAADFSLLAAEPNVRGWLGLYSFGTVTSTQGVYDFSKQKADFNAIQASSPGKSMSIYMALARFHGPQPSSQTVTTSWVPAYILSDSTYGAGTNGTQHGYSLASWNGSTGFTETSLALWRIACITEYANMLIALANEPLTATSGPWAGQTFTFDTHPGIQACFYGYESVLDLSTLSTDYSDTGLRTSLQSLYSRTRAAWRHTLLVSGLNFCKTYSNMPGIVGDLSANATGLGGPDLISYAKFSWAQHLFVGDTTSDGGSTWTSGGGPAFTGVNPSVQWAQDPDYNKAPDTQTMFEAGVTLAASHIYWSRLNNGSGVRGDWATDVLPVINANPLSTPRPSNWPAT